MNTNQEPTQQELPLQGGMITGEALNRIVKEEKQKSYDEGYSDGIEVGFDNGFEEGLSDDREAS